MILRLWACPENFSIAQGCQGYQYLLPDEPAPRCVSNRGGMLLPESPRVCDRPMVDKGLFEFPDLVGNPVGRIEAPDSSVSPGSSHDGGHVPAEVA